jgi:hypothetical protein
VRLVVSLRRRRERSEFLQPDLVVVVQARLIIVDENGRCDVRGLYQDNAILNAALINQPFNFLLNRDDRPPLGTCLRLVRRKGNVSSDVG